MLDYFKYLSYESRASRINESECIFECVFRGHPNMSTTGWELPSHLMSHCLLLIAGLSCVGLLDDHKHQQGGSALSGLLKLV